MPYEIIAEKTGGFGVYRISSENPNQRVSTHKDYDSARKAQAELNARNGKGTKLDFHTAQTQKDLSVAGSGLGYAIADDVADTATSKYKAGETVHIKGFDIQGRIKRVTRQERGGMLYGVETAKGMHIVTAADIKRVSSTVKEIPSDMAHNVMVFMRLLLASDGGLNRISDNLVNKKYIPSRAEMLNALDKVEVALKKLAPYTGRPEVGKATYYDALSSALATSRQRVNSRGYDDPSLARQIAERDTNKILRLMENVAREVPNLRRAMLEKQPSPFGQRLLKKGKKALPLSDTPLEDVIGRIVDAVSDRVDGGQPIEIAGVTLNTPDAIRMVDKTIQVKMGEADWKTLADSEVNRLATDCHCPTLDEHRGAIESAVQKGYKVPADVLVDYPQLSQDVDTQKGASPLREAYILSSALLPLYRKTGTLQVDNVNALNACVLNARAYMNPDANYEATEALALLGRAHELIESAGDQAEIITLLESTKEHLKNAINKQMATKAPVKSAYDALNAPLWVEKE